MLGCTGSQQPVAGNEPDLIGELDQARIGPGHLGNNYDFVIVAGRIDVTALSFDHRQENALAVFKILVIEPARANQFHPSDFHPHQIVGMVDDPHLVSFGIADPEIHLMLRHAERQNSGLN